MADFDKIDLTNCDREPIHLSGAIQTPGFLIAVSTDWIIARVSKNIRDLLGYDPEVLIGSPLPEYIPPTLLHDLRNKISYLSEADMVERLFGREIGTSGQPYDIAIHISDGQIVIEAEPGNAAGADATSSVRAMMSRLDRTKDMNAFYREGARQVRSMLGYDRVMVYKFAATGAGEVVAEAAKPGIGSFMGLHYPASDIPRQARQLYKRNLVRVIRDVNSEPVPIVPEMDPTGQRLDLSLSILRSVSPIHIEYLKNMGVAASLSISIVVDDELWGLFACHNYSPRSPTFARRSVCELFAEMFSMRLESRERRQIADYESKARDISDQLLGAVASDETLLNDPDWLGDILTSAIPATGVGVWINGNYAFSGMTPPTEDFRRIVRALNGLAAGRVYTTDHIGKLVEGADAFAKDAAGLLAIPISRSPRDYVVLFRQELKQAVRWAGDPHKPIEYGPNGPRLTPRESFAEWLEDVDGHAEPFTGAEIRVAETLRATLIEVVLRLADEAAAERRQSNARQEMLIAELNHRVRNILGVIRGLIRQSQPDSDEVKNFVKLVDGRIHALARAHNQITDDHWGPAPLKALIDAEAAAFAVNRQSSIISKGNPILLNPQAYSTMALVIHELVTNSTKYGSLSGEGEVHIEWSGDHAGDLVIIWQEIGGPKVTQPTRKGFGTTIVNRSVPYDLGGQASIDYAEDGVRAEFKIPSRHVSEPKSYAGPEIRTFRSAVSSQQPINPALLDKKVVLLVEDSLIIALDAEDILNRFGASVTTASTPEAAHDILDHDRIDFAILDINLGDQTSFGIADRLRELGIPFFFASGYGEQASLPMDHRASNVVQKPYTTHNIANAIENLFP
ncbi:hybrid sensor histidine kinase/response regulator [Sphingobium sp. PAMC28499]|uniref:HWE histidine kinase domain-containing protein n=1 Tax=Sphingobium TaxID=165695 RepID=UPI0009130A7F|nr:MULTISPECIES: HWE histidine kinase domain-containing protein [unclassified Sphingobium]QCB37837.1 hybrid sensor histidine kinase/response regulator [Sphingobium sp. PAMC28499]SHL72387.1 Bacteriophytochrome (light-regulated signal transduction histidine kinase) [Sphingobium sp. YR657]